MLLYVQFKSFTITTFTSYRSFHKISVQVCRWWHMTMKHLIINNSSYGWKRFALVIQTITNVCQSPCESDEHFYAVPIFSFLTRTFGKVTTLVTWTILHITTTHYYYGRWVIRWPIFENSSCNLISCLHPVFDWKWWMKFLMISEAVSFSEL